MAKTQQELDAEARERNAAYDREREQARRNAMRRKDDTYADRASPEAGKEGGPAKGALQRLTPAEAADAIRDDIESNPATIADPAMQHRMRFVTEVCHYLSLEPTPVNIQRVVDALHDAGIEDGAPEEYPKSIVYERDGQHYAVAVQDADEEAMVAAGDWDRVRSPSHPVAAPRPKGSSKLVAAEEHA